MSIADDPDGVPSSLHAAGEQRVIGQHGPHSGQNGPVAVPVLMDPLSGRFPGDPSGCQVWMLPERGEHVDLAALMDRLGAENIDSVLLEGGGTLNWSALEQELVQKVQAYIAPKLFGGGAAKSPVEGLGVETPDQAVQLINTTITPLGDDFLLESEVEHHVYRDR